MIGLVEGRTLLHKVLPCNYNSKGMSLSFLIEISYQYLHSINEPREAELPVSEAFYTLREPSSLYASTALEI